MTRSCRDAGLTSALRRSCYGGLVTSAYMPPRPVLRGVSHLVAAIVAPAGLVALLLIAASPRAYVGAAIFGAGVILLFGTSAAYHLLPWHAVTGILKRADHAMIFVFIAATYTPFCLNVLGDAWGIPLLVAVWSSAALGVVFKVARPEVPRWLGVGLYLAVGWLALVAAWPLAHRAPEVLPGLLSAGLLFSLGSVVYVFRRPDPFPRVFGYHEIFHLLVIAGVAINYGLIAGFVLRR
jgi:hemolysin III